MCKHYWEIDSNDRGVCKYCDTPRDFKSLLEKDGFRTKPRAEGRKLIFPDVPYPAEGTHSYPRLELRFRMKGVNNV